MQSDGGVRLKAINWGQRSAPPNRAAPEGSGEAQTTRWKPKSVSVAIVAHQRKGGFPFYSGDEAVAAETPVWESGRLRGLPFRRRMSQWTVGLINRRLVANSVAVSRTLYMVESDTLSKISQGKDNDKFKQSTGSCSEDAGQCRARSTIRVAHWQMTHSTIRHMLS
jgi:hypothetical protein